MDQSRLAFGSYVRWVLWVLCQMVSVSTSWTRLGGHHGQVKDAGFHPESYGSHSRVLSGFFHMVNLQRRQLRIPRSER